MIEIYGRIGGKKVYFEFEDQLSCYVVLERTNDWLDVMERKGCPEDCDSCVLAKLDKALDKAAASETE